MKIQIGTLNSRIITDNQELLDSLYRLYSEKSPGYQYSTAYRRRNWDGNIHFMAKNGTFKSGLLTRVLEDLEKGIDAKDSDITNEEEEPIDKENEPMGLMARRE